jgi:GT2 family glycosyltransferase
LVTVSPRATVVIVNYNGAHLLASCLDGVAQQRQDGIVFDTIVVDNASTDGSRDLLARDYPWVKTVLNDRNLGFAGGNNVALRTVTTPFCVLLNNDAVPEPHWLSNLLTVFSREGNEDVAIVTGKILFLPKFLPVRLSTTAFLPPSSDTRQLGAQIFGVMVNGAEVTPKVVWQDSSYGLEGVGGNEFRWSRPTGDFLVPTPHLQHDALPEPLSLTIEMSVPEPKPVVITTYDAIHEVVVGNERTAVEFSLPVGAPLVDVVNNVGGQVFANGAGGDRGFHEIDHGQYDYSAEVFTACGNGMAMRTAIGHELGWFDEDFFMYYEDTDLSWRWRGAGWKICYEPTAVLRHVHAASSVEWSPWWRFHVERNRMLMLTKNAPRSLATSAVGGYLRDTLASIVTSLKDVVLVRRRPDLADIKLRLRVLRSFMAKAPKALAERHQLRRHSRMRPTELEAWLVK